jgi:hypothetical protein
MSSKDLRGVHSSTGFCGDVRNWVNLNPFGKVVYTGQQVLVLRGVNKYGTVISVDVTSKGNEGFSALPNNATNSLSSFRL